MIWGYKRLTLISLLAVILLGVGGRAAMAAVEELPYRQRVADCVAVLRYLYMSKLQYQDDLRMVQYNVKITDSQFQTIRGVFEAEVRQPMPDLLKLTRYEATMTTLVEQLRQFSPTRYYGSMRELMGTLQQAQARLQKLSDAAVPAAASAAAPVTPAAPAPETATPPPAAPAAETAPAAAAEGGLEGAARELEAVAAPEAAATPEAPIVVAPESPAATAETTPATPATGTATPGAATAAAKTPLQQAIDDLQKSIDSLKTKIDSFNATNFIDIDKLFTQRLADVETQLGYYQSVLDARVAEYRALFGAEPSINLSYKAEIERLHPTSSTPGLLVVQ